LTWGRKDNGYRTVLIGTEQDKISFPAISSNRTTTTSHTEYVFSEGECYGVVTFNSQAQTIKLIEEYVCEALIRAVLGENEKIISKALLPHPEPRFRLSYFLGQYRITKRANSKDAAQQGYPIS
jgi:hypothetical protein